MDRYRDLHGGFGDTPTHWTSNEVWTDDAVSEVVRSGGDTAMIIGSANFPTLAPLMPNLRGVCMLDVEKGFPDLFVSRMHAADRVLREADLSPEIREEVEADVEGHYMGAFKEHQPRIGRVELLMSERYTFDLLREGDFHYMTSLAGLERLRGLFGSIAVGGFLVDASSPHEAGMVGIPPSCSEVGWVHVSNVAMMEFRDMRRDRRGPRDEDRCAHQVGTSIIDFVSNLVGVDSDTVVTYSNYSDTVRYGNDQEVPVVSASKLGSLEASDLLSEEDKRLELV